MSWYQKKPTRVSARQFIGDPMPNVVTTPTPLPWPDHHLVPYVVIDGEPVKLMEGDWIVTHGGGTREVVCDNRFRADYEPYH